MNDDASLPLTSTKPSAPPAGNRVVDVDAGDGQMTPRYSSLPVRIPTMLPHTHMKQQQDDERQTAGLPADDDAFHSSTTDESTSPELQQELDRAALMAKATKASSTQAPPQRPNGTSEGDDLIDVEASAKGRKTLRDQLASKMATLAMNTVTKSKQALAASRVAGKQAIDKSRTVVTSLQERRQARRSRRAAPSPAPVDEETLHQD